MFVKIGIDNVVIKFPYSIENLKKDFANTSFPAVLSDSVLAEYGVYPVIVAEKPIYDIELQKISIRKVPVLIEGVWTLTWAIINKTAEEIEVERVAKIPKVVTMRQARLALLQSNMLATIDTAIATGIDVSMKIEWEYATELRRDWPSLISLTTTLGMTTTELDDLFLLAGTL